jgi:formylglycine-generating enzyme required for sulfatase activity
MRLMDGNLELTEETGLVFVLIPGGTFNMGADRPSEENPEGFPNVDDQAISDESPVHKVTVQPFFLSKYEMTQGQWLRFMEENPSNHKPGELSGGKEINLRHPVENVSWEDCKKLLYRLNLRFPSEAEWEYSTRAGTGTVWWTGNEEESLKGAVNLCDLFCKNNGGRPGWVYEEWLNDGFTAHAPIGRYRPNAFGLHDVCGNVWEWCKDSYGDYMNTPTNGAAYKLHNSSNRVIRGGCWNDDAFRCRSAGRHRYPSGSRHDCLGLRPASSIQE